MDFYNLAFSETFFLIKISLATLFIAYLSVIPFYIFYFSCAKYTIPNPPYPNFPSITKSSKQIFFLIFGFASKNCYIYF
jgi:hypothetical protein